MSVILIIIALVVSGAALWAVNVKISMSTKIQNILSILIIVLLIVSILSIFGVFNFSS